MNSSEGKKLVILARKSVEFFFSEEKKFSAEEKGTKEFGGIFVTIHSFPEHELRGCIGFTAPIMPLTELAIEASLSAAFHDPRFMPLIEEELNHVIFEVSVLTEPKEFECKKELIPKKIETGKHGLIVSSGFHSGLLLPQVATEWNFNAEQFLEATCEKAGLNKNCWKEDKTKIKFFSAEIFSEKTPKGKIEKTTQ